MSDSTSTTPADSLGGGLRRAVAGLLLGVGSSAHFTWPVRLEPDAAREGREGRGTGDASSPDRPSIAVRELRLSDEQAWRALRLADNDRLAPWEATLPAGGGETPSAFASFVRHQTLRARLGEAMPFVVEGDGAWQGQSDNGMCHAHMMAGIARSMSFLPLALTRRDDQTAVMSRLVVINLFERGMWLSIASSSPASLEQTGIERKAGAR